MIIDSYSLQGLEGRYILVKCKAYIIEVKVYTEELAKTLSTFYNVRAFV